MQQLTFPQLYPAYLPLPAQHRLLVKVQALLEKACYRYAEENISYQLHSKGWDCPEAVELNVWSKLLLSNSDKLAISKVEQLGKPLDMVFDTLAQLRHTAVHRLRVSANRIEQFMIDSELLAILLEDDICAKTMCQLRRETQLTIGELQRNKDLLESTLSDELKKIDAQRTELNRLEREAVDNMVKEDKEYQGFAGANLERAILLSDEAAAQNDEPTDTETASGTDLD